MHLGSHRHARQTGQVNNTLASLAEHHQLAIRRGHKLHGQQSRASERRAVETDMHAVQALLQGKVHVRQALQGRHAHVVQYFGTRQAVQ